MTGETGISRIVAERGFKVYPMSKPYTNSALVAYKQLSPNHSGQRTQSIDRITPHCVVGQCSAEELGDWFAESSLQASSNYSIDRDGRVGLYVEEKTAPGARPPMRTTKGRSPSSALPTHPSRMRSVMWSTGNSSPSAWTSARGTERRN